MVVLFFVKQKTAYEMRISDWSSDVCSSDLLAELPDETREYLLSAFSTDDGELRLVMRSPHIAVSHVDATRDDFEAALRLAIQHGQAWNHVPWIRASMRALAELLNDTPTDRKSTRLNSSHYCATRMPSFA